MASMDSFNCRRDITAGGKTYAYFDLKEAEKKWSDRRFEAAFSLKVLLENLLRFEDGRTVKKADIESMAAWLQDKGKSAGSEIAYRPARVLMQDFTGVPAVVDLAAMRDAMAKLGGDPQKINPLVPVDLVIDHSVMVDYFGGADAWQTTSNIEYERNGERYKFLRWGQRVRQLPRRAAGHRHRATRSTSSTWPRRSGPSRRRTARTDRLSRHAGRHRLSHTTMINGLGVLGWGVGGIEAEAAMLGQPISMLIPEVVGFKLTGKLPKAPPRPTWC
jgi:aconitate hydratase